MIFDNIYAFYVLIILIILVFISGKIQDYEKYFSKDMLNKILVGKNQKKLNFGLLLGSFIFLVISLARPIIENKPIEIQKSSISVVVAFDISKSMLCEDIYPNRLEAAKNKFYNLLDNLKDEKVGAIGFSNKSFLIAPITNDYLTLKYLVKNINLKYINKKGSLIKKALVTTKELLKDSSKKALIIFTDGTDTTTYNDEINYANKYNIKVFIYTIATQKGGILKTKNGILKDTSGNIVVTRLNRSIKDLAFETNGAYLEYSTSSSDIKEFINSIKEQFKIKQTKNIIIKNNEELFYIPLCIAILLFLIAISGFKGTKQ